MTPLVDTKAKMEQRKIVDGSRNRSGAPQADYTFRIEDTDIKIQLLPVCRESPDGGCWSYFAHKLKSLEETFRSVDVTQCKSVAQRRGSAFYPDRKYGTGVQKQY